MAARKALALAQDPDADALLASDPLALLIGMVLDQQIPLEWAFKGPHTLKQRLGGRLEARQIAEMDPDELVAAFVGPPALHRFPAANAKRVQELCRIVADEHDGDASEVWRGASDGQDLYRRVKRLPGFGDHKARIFVALLGKQLDFRPDGWREAAGRFGEDGSLLSVADIVDGDSLLAVRAAKAEAKRQAKAAEGAGA